MKARIATSTFALHFEAGAVASTKTEDVVLLLHTLLLNSVESRNAAELRRDGFPEKNPDIISKKKYSLLIKLSRSSALLIVNE